MEIVLQDKTQRGTEEFSNSLSFLSFIKMQVLHVPTVLSQPPMPTNLTSLSYSTNISSHLNPNPQHTYGNNPIWLTFQTPKASAINCIAT